LRRSLYRPVRNNTTGRLDKAITPDGIYKLVRAYSAALGFEIGAHALRATAATNALDHQADIAKVQNGLDTLILPRRVSTITAAHGQRTVRRLR
jgi:integrase